MHTLTPHPYILATLVARRVTRCAPLPPRASWVYIFPPSGLPQEANDGALAESIAPPYIQHIDHPKNSPPCICMGVDVARSVKECT
jgi:hypothetical protein